MGMKVAKNDQAFNFAPMTRRGYQCVTLLSPAHSPERKAETERLDMIDIPSFRISG